MSDNEYKDFIKVPVFGISEEELATGAVGENELQQITGKKIKAGTIYGNQILAGSITSKQLASNILVSDTLVSQNRFKGSTIVFSANGKTISWTAGQIYLRKRIFGDDLSQITYEDVTINVNAGSLDITGDTYFYIEWTPDANFEPANETQNMKYAANYPYLPNDIPLIFAWYDSTLGLAQFRSITTKQGVMISGGSIIANSITANQIKAGSITADRLSFQAFDKNVDTLDSINDGYNYAKVYRTSVEAGKISLTTGVTGVLSADYSEAKSTAKGRDDGWYGTEGTGLYATPYHIGFYNDTTKQWTAYIKSDGTACFGVEGSSNYMKWDGYQLIVRGDVVANALIAGAAIQSPNITYGTISNAQITQGSITDSTVERGVINGGSARTNVSYNHRIEITSGSYTPADWGYYETVYDIIRFVNNDNTEYGYIRGYSSYNEIVIYSSSRLSVISNGYGLSIDALGTTISGYPLMLSSVGNIQVKATLRLDTGIGIKFNGTGTGGDFWFNTSDNAFYYKGTNGLTYKITATQV